MRTRGLFAGVVSAAALAAALPSSALAIQVANAKPVSGTEGASIAKQRIVTFDEPGACDRAAFTVSISWGDGQTSEGTVAKAVQSFPGTCTYDAEGGHTYRTAGQYPVTATICRGADCATTPVAGTATIADAPVRGEGLPFSAVAGTPFAGQVAEINDDNRLSEQGDFAATVDWGDGTAPTPGTVVGKEGRFQVEGAHHYAQGGVYRVVVTATHGGRTVTLDPATVNVPAVNVAPSTTTPPLSPAALGGTTRPTLRSLRRDGLRVVFSLGNRTARTVSVRLRNGAGRVMWTGRVRVPRVNAKGQSVVRIRFSKAVRDTLRARRAYTLLVPRQAGLPTLALTVRPR
jgi:hypothetical protein